MLRYETNIHGLTGEEHVEIRRIYGSYTAWRADAVLQIGDVRIFAESIAAIEKLAIGLENALEAFSAAAH